MKDVSASSFTQRGPTTGTLAVYNEWDSIAEIVVGDGRSVYFPGHHPIEDEAQHSRLRRLRNRIAYGLFQGFKVPDWITSPLREELDGLTQELVRRSTAVMHPNPVRPESDEPAGIGQMFARDPIMTVGSTLVVGALQIEMRRKELRGLEPILQSLADRGAKIARLTEPGAYLEGGDVMLDWPNVYVGIGKYGSNMAGARWLQEILGDEAQVIPVPLAVPGILHLDCCMTLIGPRLGIICRDTLVTPLPKPLDEYDFIEIDEQTRREMGGNVLVLNPRTIVLQKRHPNLATALADRGYTVVPLQFTSHANLDGAFRCATAPLRRIAAG